VKKTTKTGMRLAVVMIALLLPSLPPMGGTQGDSASKTQKKVSVVYVCACLQTKSCLCMTEAKTEGPCSCGTEGGPPLKGVPSDSAWAKENRKELAK
jgi:hypothetical protein